jgi:4-hydroxy-3-methylbut-2-enyl diphosphate reductase
MVDTAADLKPDWIEGCRRVGVTAGASAPDVLVNEVLERLMELGATRVQPLEGIAEHVVFSLPKGLAHKRGAAKAPGA